MSLLTIVQNACLETGFPSPDSVVGNTDQTPQQMLRLLNREGEILSRYEWQALKKEGTITLVASDQDYALATDFRYLIPSAMWNRDDQRRVIEPLSSEEWQFFKGWTTVSGLNLRARIRNDQLEFEQTITTGDAGKTIAYEYISKNWVEDVTETAKSSFTADDDTGLIDEELLTEGLVWRFLKAKGLPFEAELLEYQRNVKQAQSRDGGRRKLDLAKSGFGFLGVNTPEGNYGS